MRKLSEIWTKIRRKWMKIRLQPIRVFCFHQTSETYDPEVYCKPDWIPLTEFQKRIFELQKSGYEFISLPVAYRHIKQDIIRTKKYAVLTADDGLKCQLDLVPWLEKENIPLTMFLNVETLAGDKCGEPIKKYFDIHAELQEQEHAILYATKKQIDACKSSCLSFGYHGYNHINAAQMNAGEFAKNIELCRSEIGGFLSVIPFYAYAFGAHTCEQDDMLRNACLVPVYMDGNVNYNDATCIHRELL